MLHIKDENFNEMRSRFINATIKMRQITKEATNFPSKNALKRLADRLYDVVVGNELDDVSLSFLDANISEHASTSKHPTTAEIEFADSYARMLDAKDDAKKAVFG